ncbi:phenylacetate--CoA ligase family protein [bacterium]|nr:phenylacetate--CoA ligase family protein [bacterium]
MILKILLEKKRVLGMNSEQLKKFHLKKLRKLFNFAKKNSVYYADLFEKNGLEKISSIDKFGKIPFLTKDIIRKNINNIRIKKVEGYEVRSTGSSGEPIKIFKDKESIYRTLVMGNPFFIGKYLNIKLNNLLLLLLNDKHSIENLLTNPMKRFFKLERHKLHIDLSVKDMVDYIIKHNIEFIITYPHIIKNIANYVTRNNINITSLKLVLISGELSTKNYIEKYEKLFNAVILNSYIATEGGIMATYLPNYEGMKIIHDNVYIEVINKKGEAVFNEEGRIVITDLNNRAFPMIRYLGLNDTGIISLNKEGIPYLEVISGREMDEIINSKGRHFSSYFITDLIEGIPAVEKFQIHQLKPNIFNILIETGKKDEFVEGSKHYSFVKEHLEALLQENVQLTLDVVTEIKKESDMFYVVRRHFSEDQISNQ